MIIDKVSRSAAYNHLVPEFEEAMSFALKLTDQPVGKYEYGGFPEGTVYAIVSEGETGSYEEGKLEAHRSYIDVQIILGGGETVFYDDIDELTVDTPYDEGGDVILYKKGGQPAQINPGMFYLVFPHDAHMPTRHLNDPGHFRKIILKIKVR